MTEQTQLAQHTHQSLEAKLFGIVDGEKVAVPEDLFIPSEALLVLLESFEGPLDLLLYLIRKHNLDILKINVDKITKQYLTYLDLMQELNIELASEYLLMASILTEIKSSSLLFKPAQIEEEEDPKADLIRRLLEYERFKKAAEDLDMLERCDRDFFIAKPEIPNFEEKPVDISLEQLTLALAKVFKRQAFKEEHFVEEETISIGDKMRFVFESLPESPSEQVLISCLYAKDEGIVGVVTTFMAVLELAKQKQICIEQERLFSPIYLSRAEQIENADS